jgi:hypothetical protein
VNSIPHELALGDVLLSPVLPVISVALIATWLTTVILNKLRLSRYIMFPSISFLAIMTAYFLLMDAFWLKI